MIRFGSRILCTTLGVGLLACGSNGTSDGNSAKDPLDLVPLDNDVSGWTVDQEHTKVPGARAMTATTEKAAVNLIDGGAAPFFKAPSTPKMFLWQNYANDTLPAAPPPDGATLLLYILQMPSVEQATGLYTALLKEADYTRKTGTEDDWKDPTTPLLGADSRIQDTGTQWWINFRKDTYYVEVMLFPSYGPGPTFTIGDPDLKQEALRFAQAIASKM
jgi:hypothetical protein